MIAGGQGVPDDAYPFAETEAARMLKSRLEAEKAVGVSLRTLAKRMRYSPAVLSHMANGRVGVPLDRATEIARVLELDQRDFLTAVVAQRAPEARDLLAENGAANHGFVAELAMMAGGSFADLSEEQRIVMREVAADPRPTRRWLSVAELPAVALIRQARPGFREHGLSSGDMNWISGLTEIDP